MMTYTAFMLHLKTILTGIANSLKLKTRSHHNSSTNEEPVFITLDESRKDPALVKEMSSQLNEASIITGSQNGYVAGVNFKGHQYYISGTHREWLSFYGMDRQGQSEKTGV
jgi:hypothetical protein